MQAIWLFLEGLFTRIAAMVYRQAPLILLALLIFILGIFLSSVGKNLVRRGLRFRRSDAEFSLLVGRLVQWSIIFFAFMFATQQVGIDITALLTGLGILGFTIGFALQDISKNLVSGALMLLQKPFRLGDTIEVSGFTGTVLNITLRDTLLLTADGLRVRIPNGDIFVKPILNYSKLQRRRLQLNLGVAYGSDLESVRRVAQATIAAIPGVLQDPPVEIVFESFAEHAIRLRIAYWYDENQTNYSQALDAGVSGLKAAFDREGIEIPVPYRELRLINGPNGQAKLTGTISESSPNPQTDPAANAETKE